MSMLTFALNIQSVKAAAQINLLTHSGWLDSTGYYHVVGEVENVGNDAAGLVEITVTFYNSSDVVVATSSTYPALDILLAGRKSPFEVLIVDTAQAAKVHHYSLSVTFSVATPIPENLQILSQSSYTDGLGYMHIVGQIKNTAAAIATYVKAIVTFYNSTGNVVAAILTFSNPEHLNAGQTAPFEAILVYTNRVPLVASYALTAESQQYAIVPEFPSIMVLPLFMILSLFAFTVSKRMRRSKLD